MTPADIATLLDGLSIAENHWFDRLVERVKRISIKNPLKPRQKGVVDDSRWPQKKKVKGGNNGKQRHDQEIISNVHLRKP